MKTILFAIACAAIPVFAHAESELAVMPYEPEGQFVRDDTPIAFHSTNASNIILLFDAAGGSVNPAISFNYILTNDATPKHFRDFPFYREDLAPGTYTLANIDFGGGDTAEINAHCGTGNTISHCLLEYFTETLSQRHTKKTITVGAPLLEAEHVSPAIVPLVPEEAAEGSPESGGDRRPTGDSPEEAAGGSWSWVHEEPHEKKDEARSPRDGSPEAPPEPLLEADEPDAVSDHGALLEEIIFGDNNSLQTQASNEALSANVEEESGEPLMETAAQREPMKLHEENFPAADFE